MAEKDSILPLAYPLLHSISPVSASMHTISSFTDGTYNRPSWRHKFRQFGSSSMLCLHEISPVSWERRSTDPSRYATYTEAPSVTCLIRIEPSYEVLQRRSPSFEKKYMCESVTTQIPSCIGKGSHTFPSNLFSQRGDSMGAVGPIVEAGAVVSISPPLVHPHKGTTIKMTARITRRCRMPLWRLQNV